MLNLDPGLLDQDKIRLKKRKKLLAIYTVPVIVILFFAAFMIRTGIYNMFLTMEDSSKTFGTTNALNEFQKVGNILEPYIVYYNGGYIKLVNAESRFDLMSAEELFKESLKQNPPESMLCPIYGNMAYALELQADIFMSEKDYTASIVAYDRAESLLRENGCEEEEKNQVAQDRIANKRRKAIASANNTVDEGDEDEATSRQVDEDELKELQEIQKQSMDAINSRLRLNQARSKGVITSIGGSPGF